MPTRLCVVASNSLLQMNKTIAGLDPVKYFQRSTQSSAVILTVKHANDGRAMYTIKLHKTTIEEETGRTEEKERERVTPPRAYIRGRRAVSQTPERCRRYRISWAKWPSCGDARMSERALRPSQQYVLITHSV